MTKNCLIIDDEPLARSLIRRYVELKTDLVVVGECINPPDAYELLLNNHIDVIFLDIQMPIVSGMDFLRSLKHPPKIIFTTAHSNYAAEAFDLDAVDYLVKPITIDRFEQAIVKLTSSFKSDSEETKSTESTVSSPDIDHVFFKTDGKLRKVFLSDILYLEALKDFTKVILKDGKSILLGEHLKAIENMLSRKTFIRSHRSYLVSVKAISGIFGNTIEIDKIQLPIGAAYKDDLLKTLNI